MFLCTFLLLCIFSGQVWSFVSMFISLFHNSWLNEEIMCILDAQAHINVPANTVIGENSAQNLQIQSSKAAEQHIHLLVLRAWRHFVQSLCISFWVVYVFGCSEEDEFDQPRLPRATQKEITEQLIKDGYNLDLEPDDEDLDLIPPRPLNERCSCCQMHSNCLVQ